MSYIWITPRRALMMVGQKKLAALTNEIGQQESIGTGDGSTRAFRTPFVFGSEMKVYANSVLTSGYAFSIDYTNGERVVVTFTTAPVTNIKLTASSTDSVNADNLDHAILRAQGLVRGSLDAQLYSVPSDDTAIPEPLIGWAAAIAWYLLASDPRRPRLLEAYPELEKRYIDVYGGVDSDLKRVARGNFSLRGILTVLDPMTTGLVAGSQFISDEVVYTPERFRGVM
jgi:hypothetical protein